MREGGKEGRRENHKTTKPQNGDKGESNPRPPPQREIANARRRAGPPSVLPHPLKHMHSICICIHMRMHMHMLHLHAHVTSAHAHAKACACNMHMHPLEDKIR